MIIELPIEVILSIIVPLGGTGLFIIRYLWKKEQCFILMKQKIEELSNSDSDSDKTHDDLKFDITEQGSRITALEAKLDLIISHFNIKSK